MEYKNAVSEHIEAVPETYTSNSRSTGDELMPTITRVRTSGHQNEVVHLGEHSFYKHELQTAFGMNLGLHEKPDKQLADPSVLGLCAFSLSTFVLGMLNLGVGGITITNMIVTVGFFYGGLGQFVVGMWEIYFNNTFAATTFTSFGAFYMSFVCIDIPFFGVAEAYASDPRQYSIAVGIFLTGWVIFAFIAFVCCIRATWPLFLMMGCVWLSLLTSCIAYYTLNLNTLKITGGFNLATAFLGWYMALCLLCSKEVTYFNVPALYMPGAQRPKEHDA